MERFSYGSLYHWGIPKMRWGRRRYQYEDGSLTPEGRRRYGRGLSRPRHALDPSELTRDLKREKLKNDIAEMDDDLIKSVSDRLDMEKSYLDKSIDVEKKIGEASVPRYLQIIKDVRATTDEVTAISRNVADTITNFDRAKRPFDYFKGKGGGGSNSNNSNNNNNSSSSTT